MAKVVKGAWRMPWLTEAMKDVISCDKPGVGANDITNDSPSSGERPGKSPNQVCSNAYLGL